MQRDLEVKSKGVQGKNDIPFVTLQGNDGSKLKLILEGESQLDSFEIGETYTIKVCQEQTRLLAEETE